MAYFDIEAEAKRVSTAFALAIVEGYPQDNDYWLRCEGLFGGMEISLICERSMWPDHMNFHLNGFAGALNVAKIDRYSDGSVSRQGSIIVGQKATVRRDRELVPLMWQGLTALGMSTAELENNFAVTAHERVMEWPMQYRARLAALTL